MVRFVLPVLASFAAAAQTRLSNDSAKSGGYVSAYTLATGQSYTDAVLSECSIARGRQNEPSVAVDPRDLRVLIGSSNDYCGVYAGSTPGNFAPNGPIWLGYYRSEDGGASFVSSLVPGYPGDASPFASLPQIRTASSGDPVIAWDNHGRVFMGSESSGDPTASVPAEHDVMAVAPSRGRSAAANSNERWAEEGSGTVHYVGCAATERKFCDAGVKPFPTIVRAESACEPS